MAKVDFRVCGKTIRFREDVKFHNYVNGATRLTIGGIVDYTEEGELLTVSIKVTRRILDDVVAPFMQWLLDSQTRGAAQGVKSEVIKMTGQINRLLLDNEIINLALQEELCQFPCAIENIEIFAGDSEIDGHPIWLNYEDWCKVNS